MYEWAQKIVQFTNMSPVFKGGSVTIAGLVALLFALWMRQRWKEPLKGGFMVFVALAAFVVLYGIFILIAQPHWWNPPY